MTDTTMSSRPPVEPRAATRLRAVGARITGGLLQTWQVRNVATTIPHSIRMLHEYGHIGNFERFLTGERTPFAGFVFADSDLHKAMEGIAWTPPGGDAETDAFFDRVLDLYEAVQEPDGYLNTAFQGWDAVQSRWSDFPQGHELYSLGHLIQAGIAARRNGRGDRLLEVARRFADLAVRMFGGPDRPEVPGHPEVEMALVELYRETGERSYLDLASAFVERRGRGWLGARPHGPFYYQDSWPLRETRSLYGHAVRAMYLCAGAADVAIETGDAGLLEHLGRLWDDMLATKSHITGGIGSRHRDEAFGDAYELPAERAYAETCAAIGLIHWGWRMLLATGDGKYADHVETVLFNAFAVGLGQDGCSFFYSNPLQRRADHLPSQEEGAGARLPWFHVSCCPPNIMRMMATLQHYIATADGDEVRVHLPVDGIVEAELDAGPVRLRVTGGYPWSATFHVEILGSPEAPWTLRFRLPNGTRDVRVDGGSVEPVGGALELRRAWRPGTRVEIAGDLPVRRVRAHPAVDALRGSSAFLRGPLVYCAEAVDNPIDLDRVVVPAASAARVDEDGELLVIAAEVRSAVPAALYSESPASSETEPVDLVLRPYFLWGNRELGSMRVWLPDAETGA